MRSGCEQATVCFVAIAVVLAAASHGYAQDTEPAELRAGVLPERFAIDGRLDEPVWGMAEFTEAFAQADPMEGAAPSARTLVRVLAGPKALLESNQLLVKLQYAWRL
jgi:hypothetical protein